MPTRPANELLYDSEASFRLVDNVLNELRSAPSAEAPGSLTAGTADDHSPVALAALPHVLAKVYGEIVSVLESLRQSRDVLEKNTVEQIQHTHEKLQEVTSAIEVAATDIMDAVDRALGMVDELDSAAEADTAERAAEVRQSLRDELFGMMGCLQFHDITTQQTDYASSVLVDTKDRLAQLARIFDPQQYGVVVAPVVRPTASLAFDPAATTADAESRQALVDQIFGA